MTNDPRWDEKAACRGHANPDLWFPERGSPNAETREALRICFEDCGVRAECLAYAQELQIPFGIWGGVQQKARWQMRRGMRAESPMPRWATSPLYTDPNNAQRAFDSAQRIGVKETAKQMGVDPRTLYRAWARHGMGLPVRKRELIYSRTSDTRRKARIAEARRKAAAS